MNGDIYHLMNGVHKSQPDASHAETVGVERDKVS
jgi:hypothetical protein